MTDIGGRTAVVTGGGGGIGSGLARELARQGATVVVADEITQAGGQAIALACGIPLQDPDGLLLGAARGSDGQ